MSETQDENTSWIARLTPVPGTDIERLLQMPFGLDVWEREPNSLVVRAYEDQLRELERRHLAVVERRYTVKEYLSDKGSEEDKNVRQ
jgi:hypothetical protein